MLFGSRPHAVVRLRGWERYAFVLWLLCISAIGALSFANLFGATIPSSVTHNGEIAAGALTIVALVAILRAMNRYEGELRDTPRSRTDRLIARFTHRA